MVNKDRMIAITGLISSRLFKISFIQNDRLVGVFTNGYSTMALLLDAEEKAHFHIKPMDTDMSDPCCLVLTGLVVEPNGRTIA